MSAWGLYFSRYWKRLFQRSKIPYCLVGNIVQSHPHGELRDLLSGTKHFTPGTNVYCLPPQWGDGFERTIAIGVCRKSRRWITVVMRTGHITNWRAQPIYKPVVLQRLQAGLDGFKHQWKSLAEVEKWVQALRRE